MDLDYTLTLKLHGMMKKVNQRRAHHTLNELANYIHSQSVHSQILPAKSYILIIFTVEKVGGGGWNGMEWDECT